MKAKTDLACAASHVEVDWPAMDWRKVTQNVRRLQARIVKATNRVPLRGVSKGLSCMTRKCHVQFLGEGAAATPSPYPTLITQTPPNTRVNPTLPPLRFGNAGYAERWAAMSGAS